MDATPFEQVVVVAVATYCTGELTVSPFVGLVTVTLAKAGAANIKSATTTEWKFFMALPSAFNFERAHSAGFPIHLRCSAGDDWFRGVGNGSRSTGLQHGAQNFPMAAKFRAH
jgi:hypothetical protein